VFEEEGVSWGVVLEVNDEEGFLGFEGCETCGEGAAFFLCFDDEHGIRQVNHGLVSLHGAEHGPGFVGIEAA